MLYLINMKAIQITMDEDLLERLDATEEVRREGRSAVLRKAAALYLRQRRAGAIASAYQRAYAKRGGLGTEFTGWDDEGTWPDA